eukprot:2086383-Alexandrium_andersonii.AAC.1
MLIHDGKPPGTSESWTEVGAPAPARGQAMRRPPQEQAPSGGKSHPLGQQQGRADAGRIGISQG